MVDGGQWHERHAALGDLPHFTCLDEHEQQQQQSAAVTSSDESQLDATTDGLEEINLS